MSTVFILGFSGVSTYSLSCPALTPQCRWHGLLRSPPGPRASCFSCVDLCLRHIHLPAVSQAAQLTRGSSKKETDPCLWVWLISGDSSGALSSDIRTAAPELSPWNSDPRQLLIGTLIDSEPGRVSLALSPTSNALLLLVRRALPIWF